MALAAIAAVSVSCTEEQPGSGVQQSRVEISFTGRTAETTDTRTALQDGAKVVWTEGDAIGVFGDSDKAEQFTLESIDASNASIATFTGSIIPADTYYAIYPYDSDAVLSGNTISMELPADQTAVAGTFASGVSLAAAVADNGSLQFWNLCGLISLTLSSVPEGYTLQSVTLEGRNGEKISGAVSVSVPELTPAAGENAGMSVTLTAADGASLTAGTYVFTIIPAEFTQGVRVIFDYGTAGKAEIVSDQALTVNAGENHVLPALEAKIQTLVPLDGIRHWPNANNDGALPNEMIDCSVVNDVPLDYPMLFDGITTDQLNMWHTPGSSETVSEENPIIATFDLGAEYYLSSYKVWGRYGGTVDNPMGDRSGNDFTNYFAFGSYNPRKFKLYGSAFEPKNPTDQEYWAVNGGWLQDWTLLDGDGEVIRPSQNVPTVKGSQTGTEWIPTAEDYEAAANGFEFEIDRDLPAVRYVRIVITKTWDPQARYRISFGELHFYSYTPDENEE